MNQKEQVDLPDLITAAMKDTDESWGFVDEHLPALCLQQKVYSWAANEGLTSENGNVQDLAASIFEYQIPDVFDQATQRFPTIKSRLEEVMTTSENPYARYRSAFALFKHGSRSKQVIAKITEATTDEDVNEIAQKYLEQLN